MKAKDTKDAASPEHERLLKELRAILPSLNEEGLAFLLEQARVHLYNMEIERQEAESRAEDLAAAMNTAKKAKRGASGVAGTASAAGTMGAASAANYRIERSASGSSYHLITGGHWKMYNEAEMIRMVKIAGHGSEPEAAERLHAWLMEERPDTFADLDIGDERDPRMVELVGFLRAKFAIRER
jgi:hypothetical protein